MIEAHAAAAALHAWHSFAPGARVYDSESGQDATVLGSQILHTVNPHAGALVKDVPTSLFNLPVAFVSESVLIRLDDGTAATRDAAELVALPGTFTSLPADLAGPPK